jgi:uncharacterized membrane protein YdjX (TVP38/TMEM64 family)
MTTQRTWVWIGGGVLAVVAALALGVPLGTIVVLAAVLACPLAMYFGMRGMSMGQGCRHDAIHEPAEDGISEKGVRVRQGEPDRR